MGFFREITIKWQGESYKFTPTMQSLAAWESEHGSVMALLVGQKRGNLFELSQLVGFFLRQGGANVTDEEVWGAMVGGSASEVNALIDAVSAGVMPAPKEEKKDDAPGKKK